MARARKTRAKADSRQEANESGVHRAGLYARLSVFDNGRVDGDSMETQIELMKQYVSEHSDLRFVKLYQDNGFSGTTFLRPGWDELMRDVAAGLINCVVVKDLSRFGRNYIETGNFLEKDCPRLGLRFISVNDRYDSASANANQQLTAALKNIINDYYAKDISRKISASLAAKRKRGEYIGSYAPYGYLKDPDDKSRLIIDPETAPIVRQMYEWRAAGEGIGKILRRLNEQGIPSPGRYRYEHGIVTNNNKKGAALLWGRHITTEILRNPVYIGTLQQGKFRASLYQGIPGHVTDSDEWDVVRHTHEAIVSEELFQAVQAVNQRQSDDYKSYYGKYSYLPKEMNPYGKKLTCADCGSVLKLYRSLANDGTRAYYSYICPAHEEKGEMACTKKSVRSMIVNQAVLVALRIQIQLFLDTSKVLSTLMENERQIRERETPEKKIRSLQRKLERKRILSSTLYSDWKSGLLTLDEYLFGKRKYAQDMEELNRRIAAAEQRKQASKEKISDIERWTQQLAQYQNAAEVTKELADALIDSITMDAGGNLSIRFRFDGAKQTMDEEISRIRKDET